MTCLSPFSLQQWFELQELEPMVHHSQHARATKVGSAMKAKALSLFSLVHDTSQTALEGDFVEPYSLL